MVKERGNSINKISFNNTPSFFLEIRSKTIRGWSFLIVEREQSIQHFIRGDRTVKKVQVIRGPTKPFKVTEKIHSVGNIRHKMTRFKVTNSLRFDVSLVGEFIAIIIKDTIERRSSWLSLICERKQCSDRQDEAIECELFA